MTPEQMQQLTAALSAGLNAKSAATVDSATIQTIVNDSLAPALKSIQDSQKAIEDERRKTEGEAAVKAAKDAFDKAVKDAREEGHKAGLAEGQMRADALSLIADANVRAQVAQSPIKDLLVAATQDVMPNAASLPEAMLHGAVLMKKQAMDSRQQQPVNPALNTAFGNAPAAVTPTTPLGNVFQLPQATTVDAKKQSNIDAYYAQAEKALETGVIGELTTSK